MIICTYSIHDEEPVVRAHAPNPRRWLVKLYATDGEVRITSSIKNKQPARLSELLQQAHQAVDDLLGELPGYTDAGFQVQLLR